MTEFTEALESEDPTVSTAQLAAIYAATAGVTLDQAHAATIEAVAKLALASQAEIALASGAPAEQLLALAEEIDDEIRELMGAHCSCADVERAELRTYQRVLHAVAASRAQ